MTGTGAPRGRPKKRGKIWNFRLIRASASEVGARDLADGTRDDVDVARSGAGRVRLRGVDDSVEARIVLLGFVIGSVRHGVCALFRR